MVVAPVLSHGRSFFYYIIPLPYEQGQGNNEKRQISGGKFDTHQYLVGAIVS